MKNMKKNTEEIIILGDLGQNIMTSKISENKEQFYFRTALKILFGRLRYST